MNRIAQKVEQLFCAHRWERRPRQHMTEKELRSQAKLGKTLVPWRCKDCNRNIVTEPGGVK